MCLNPKSLEFINPTILQLLIRAGWWLTTVTGWTLALCIASNKTLDSTDDWDKRGDNFCPNIKDVFNQSSVVDYQFAFRVSCIKRVNFMIYYIALCNTTQYLYLCVFVCVCFYCLRVSLFLWVFECLCVFVSLCVLATTYGT